MSSSAQGENGGESSGMSSSGTHYNARDGRSRSHAIDKVLEQDSKQFRKECKILLLGEFTSMDHIRSLTSIRRVGREWEIDYCQADEDYTSERIQQRRAAPL